MGSGMPGPQNYRGAAEQTAQGSQQAVNNQTQANRPDQSSPFASSTWTTGPDGRPQQSTSFNGALGGLSGNLQQQAYDANSTPFSLGSLPGLTDGAQARDQAINSAYGQATSRLDPQFQQQHEQLTSSLLNQGLQPGSQAYNDAMANFGRTKNDAYNGALSGAIGQGTAAGNQLFQNSLATRQNALGEQQYSRNAALGQLGQLNGLTGQQGFQGAGLAQAPDYLGAAGLQGSQDWQRYQYQQQQIQDAIQGGVGLLGSVAPFFLCDARAKQNIMHVGTLDGLPVYLYRYRADMGPEGLYRGHLAHEVLRAHPQEVRIRPSGMLEVSARFAPVRIA